MRIALVGPASPWRGGIAHFNDLLVKELRGRHEVHVLTFTRQYPSLLFPGSSQTHPGEASLDVGAEPLLDSIGPWSWWNCARRLRSLAPELLVFRYWMPFFAPCFGSVLRWSVRDGEPECVVIADNVVPHERRPFDGALTRFFLSRADRFVVMTRSVADDLQRFRGDAPVSVVPHPLYGQFGEAQPREEARRALGLSSSEPVLLYFGLVRRYKGLDVLLHAMASVRRRLPAKLLIVGEFYEDVEKYRKLVSDLGLEEAVRMVPEYVGNDQVAPWFSAADVVVLPYRHATQSGIVPIAFHMERPVICSDVGGLGEVVRHGHNGLLVKPDDAASLAEAILHFYEEDLGPKLGEGVREARQHFTWSAFARAVVGESGA